MGAPFFGYTARYVRRQSKCMVAYSALLAQMSAPIRDSSSDAEDQKFLATTCKFTEPDVPILSIELER